jgi:predicted transposase/invertase (TIGR01784 family)
LRDIKEACRKKRNSIDVKPEQLRESVTEALEEGGAMMSTIWQQVLEKGKEIGVKEGDENKALRVALNCLKKGMDVQTIAEITDLPVERIELLKTAVQKENTAHK